MLYTYTHMATVGVKGLKREKEGYICSKTTRLLHQLQLNVSTTTFTMKITHTVNTGVDEENNTTWQCHDVSLISCSVTI